MKDAHSTLGKNDQKFKKRAFGGPCRATIMKPNLANFHLKLVSILCSTAHTSAVAHY